MTFSLIFSIGIIVSITFLIGAVSSYKEEKTETMCTPLEHECDFIDYDGMGNFSRFGSSRRN